MDDLIALRALATRLGVHTEYTDGLDQPVIVAPETLVQVCAALGAPVTGPWDAAGALAAIEAPEPIRLCEPVSVAWDGMLRPIEVAAPSIEHAELQLEDGRLLPMLIRDGAIRVEAPLPLGYHRLRVAAAGRVDDCTVIAAPVEAYRRPGTPRSWGVGTQLAALRTSRSRAIGDLTDLEWLCHRIGDHGGDLVTMLPLLPTFNDPPVEPSPYSAVSRLFWSELILDLGEAHRPAAPPDRLDVARAAAEVRAALADHPLPEAEALDPELRRYARFRGAQAVLGRNWRAWPPAARDGVLGDDQVDAAVERLHLTSQALVRHQLHQLRGRLDARGIRLGLDLAVGVDPDGYDTWSRPALFADGMSVGAPPDIGFPSGQDWGFRPVLPTASRAEGHRYLAASIGHQMALAGVLRVDHVMAFTRLYWIPHGFGLDQGTYVSYPAEELFAVLTLESVRHRCEVVGENLGTVPPEIGTALPRHRIWGMYLAEFEAVGIDRAIEPPTERDVALIGTHDTPTLAGWLTADDVADRLQHRLLAPEREQDVRDERRWGATRLAEWLGVEPDDPVALLEALLDWLGRSSSPLVVPWLEDLWLEPRGVNLPGTRSADRPNWQRPLAAPLEVLLDDPAVQSRLDRLDRARTDARHSADSASSHTPDSP